MIGGWGRGDEAAADEKGEVVCDLGKESRG